MGWRPLLVGDDATRARDAIAEIVTRLDAHDFTEPSLLRGSAGAALVAGERARAGDRGADERVQHHLSCALAQLDDAETIRPMLGTGVAGVGWVTHQLRDVVGDAEEVLAPIDAMVGDLLARDRWRGEYELWEGLVGLGVYALERGRDDLVARVVHHLDRVAERVSPGATWWNRDMVDFSQPGVDPRGYHDLGIALGAAGAIALLAEACAAGVAAEIARPLLDEAVAWLLAHEDPAARPRFRPCVGIEARLRADGWCHGDLGTAAVLVRAGSVAREPTWIARGLEVARTAAAQPIEDARAIDLAFCHGTAGRAHLLARLAHATGDAALEAAAVRYYRETLDRIPGAEQSPVLIAGWGGIALVLGGALATEPPRWDRVCLVALPVDGDQPQTSKVG